jgi:phosphoglycerate dehydrogenase-like enzyme
LENSLREIQRSHPERVTLTPHSASAGPWTWVRDSQELWLNVRRWLDGEPVHHAI